MSHYVNGELHKTMINILLKLWTAFEIILFLEWRRKQKAQEQEEEDLCNSPTQAPPKNTSDTP